MTIANICSVCSLKFLPQSLTMIWSLARHGGEYRFHILLSDITSAEGTELARAFPSVDFHFIDQFADQRILDIALLLTNLEFNVALKARAMSHVFGQHSGPVFYCDSDLFFVSEINTAIQQLADSGILLTPHQIAATNHAAEFSMARTGVFNSGFVGASGAAGRSFVRWWEDKCISYCLLEPEEGLFVDQKWLDLVPALFDGVISFRHPGYNLAYWNLDSRCLDERSVVLHLSGLDPTRELAPGDTLSKYSDLRVDAKLASLLAPYFAQFKKNASDLARLFPKPSGPTSFGRLIADDETTITKRYSARKFILSFQNGTPQRRFRPSQEKYLFASLYHREVAFIRLSRFLGRFLVGIGLGGLAEKMISLFRILGRRTNWLE